MLLTARRVASRSRSPRSRCGIAVRRTTRPLGHAHHRAYAKFQAADYPAAEQAWASIAENFPKEPLAFANWATVLIILASDGMSLGVKPTGEPLARLERALDCLEKAEALGSRDALLLNDRGNALGLLQRWEGRAPRTARRTVAPRRTGDPRSNEALIRSSSARRRAPSSGAPLRGGPAFKDGEALLAAPSGRAQGVQPTVAQLCNERRCAPRPSTSWDDAEGIERARPAAGEGGAARLETGSRAR